MPPVAKGMRCPPLGLRRVTGHGVARGESEKKKEGGSLTRGTPLKTPPALKKRVSTRSVLGTKGHSFACPGKVVNECRSDLGGHCVPPFMKLLGVEGFKRRFCCWRERSGAFVVPSQAS